MTVPDVRRLLVAGACMDVRVDIDYAWQAQAERLPKDLLQSMGRGWIPVH